MGIENILSSQITTPVEALGNVLDQLFTSDEERETLSLLKEKLYQNSAIVQAEINKIEAQHRSLFVAGWRPFIGWICGLGLGYAFIIDPIIQWLTGQSGPVLPTSIMHSLVLSLLGLGTLRTVEKFGNRTK